MESANGSSIAAPPRVPFVLSVGVTGHRADLLDGATATVGRRIDSLIDDIAASIEVEFTNDRLHTLVDNGGWDPAVLAIVEAPNDAPTIRDTINDTPTINDSGDESS